MKKYFFIIKVLFYFISIFAISKLSLCELKLILVLFISYHADILEGEAIENNEEEEGDEGHDDKVSNEKIVSAVSVVISEGGCTDSGIQ